MKLAQSDKDDIKKQGNTLSRGLKKLANYYLEVLFTQHFLHFVKKIRKKYNIAENGYNLEQAIDKKQPNEWKTHFQFPLAWFRDQNRDREKHHLENVRNDVETFLKQHDLDPNYCYDYAMNYIFYNNFLMAELLVSCMTKK